MKTWTSDPRTVSRQRYERERTARKAAEKLLNEKSLALFEVQRARSHFLTLLSHEIRTPLNGVLGASQVLSDLHSGNPFVSSLMESGQALKSLIDTLICLAELDERRLQIETAPFDLAGLLQDMRLAFKVTADEKGLDLVLRADAQMIGAATGDRKRLREVLSAVLANAIKFTEAGMIEIGARRDGDRVRLTIADSGIGIAPEQREQIFARFHQGERFLERVHGGAGIGLSLAQELVHLMGGTIEAGASALGGAEIRMDLHLPVADDWVPYADDLTLEERGRPIHVLIVDDNPVNQMVAGAAVKAADMTFETAGNGAEALERLARERFDVVLMDIQMPVMSGDEAIRRMRAEPAIYGHAPIVVITAHSTGGGGNLYREMGANETMEKPIQFDRLTCCIRNVLSVVKAA